MARPEKILPIVGKAYSPLEMHKDGMPISSDQRSYTSLGRAWFPRFDEPFF
jgi:hypothetical protein